MQLLKPAKLKPGDLIGVAAPAGPVLDATRIERGVRYVEKMGYRVRVGKSVTRVTGYLAGSDAERVSDLHELFADSEVKAILCARGGYGTTRLLPLLDYALVTRHPKILVGFSDITALQLALWRQCRLVTFHGPMLAVEMAKEIPAETEAWFWHLITSNCRPDPLILPPSSAATLSPGRAVGRLLGGNLSVLTSLLGTPYQPVFNRALFFLEEVSEEPYSVDRMLTQLRNAGILSKVAGVLSGQFKQCQPKDASKPSFTVEEVLREVATKLGKPYLAELPFGHVAKKLTLPMGIRTHMDADTHRLQFLEAGVR